MKEKTTHVRIYKSAYDKLKEYCIANDKFMTTIISRLVKDHIK